jgi:hypothetical protein
MSQQNVVYVRSEASNGMGLAGFIISLVGLMSCGLVSPIGLVLSWIGLSKEPKGLAIAGLVLGLLGSLWIVVALAFGLFGGLLAVAGLSALGEGLPATQP